MKKLSIPYTLSGPIMDAMEPFKDSIEEIYTAPNPTVIGSARPFYGDAEQYQRRVDEDMEKAVSMGIKPVLLANDSRTVADGFVLKVEKIRDMAEKFKYNWGCEKIVIASVAVATMLGGRLKNLGYKLAASVLMEIDNMEKAVFAIEQLGMDEICFTNDVIRDKDMLKALKAKYPDVKLKVLVNNGCMPSCISLQQHHAACANPVVDNNNSIEYARKLENTRTLTLASRLCDIGYSATPWKFLSRGFIRPEDMAFYDDVIDSYKISGRDKQIGEVVDTIRAYANRSYDGDLMTITDIPSGILRMYGVNNKAFPDGYVQKVSNCKQQCDKCSYCKDLANEIMTRRGDMGINQSPAT